MKDMYDIYIILWYDFTEYPILVAAVMIVVKK
jgi:hypothetical protein